MARHEATQCCVSILDCFVVPPRKDALNERSSTMVKHVQTKPKNVMARHEAIQDCTPCCWLLPMLFIGVITFMFTVLYLFLYCFLFWIASHFVPRGRNDGVLYCYAVPFCIVFISPLNPLKGTSVKHCFLAFPLQGGRGTFWFLILILLLFTVFYVSTLCKSPLGDLGAVKDSVVSIFLITSSIL